MKRTTIFLLISISFLILIWSQIIYWYLINHWYYFDYLSSTSHLFPFLISLVFAWIPLLYLIFSKKKTLSLFFLFLFVGLLFFSIYFISTKWWVWGNYIILFLNIVIMLFFSTLFIFWVFFLWNYIKERFLKLKTENIFELFLSFWIGLSVLLIFVFILMSFWIIFSWLIWLIFIALLLLYLPQRDSISNSRKILLDILDSIWYKNNKNKWTYIFSLVLILFSIAYFYFWFILAYIPYPTAWDANHAYMFYPKMWVLNEWFYWDESQMSTRFQLWYSYIAYWFALAFPLERLFWISADTYAIVWNFFSWIFVLLFSLALLKEVINYISDRIKSVSNYSWLIFNMSWLFVLLWLTSWMWAFLVFVDNKTDLWVMAIVILAIYSWFVAIKKTQEIPPEETNENAWNNEENNDNKGKLTKLRNIKINYNLLIYFVISWFLFAVAVMSKPTAFLDAVWFWLLLTWLWIWWIAVISIFIIIIWLLSFVEFRGIRDYISYANSLYSIIIWFAWFFVSVFLKFTKNFFSYLLLMVFWWLSFVLTLVIFKWSYILYEDHMRWREFDSIRFVEDIFLSQNSEIKEDKFDSNIDDSVPLLASTSMAWLNDNSCSLSWIEDSDDLYEWLRDAPWDTYAEDVWRYVGYWWRHFENPWWQTFFPSWNSCIWPNWDSNILCTYSSHIQNMNKDYVLEAYDQLSWWSAWYDYLHEIVSYEWFDSESESYLINKFSEEISSIEEYYQSNSIYIENVCIVGEWTDVDENCVVYESEELARWDIINQNDLYIPYSYLVPFNMTFNWSLQNESSFYTDVWYIWLILLFLIIIWLFYWIFIFDKLLIGISSVTLLIWTIWFFIWGWILWYWLWLIIWIILSFLVFVYRLSVDVWDNKNNQLLFNIFIWIIIFISFFMIFLNFLRISWQWWAWPFMWYKQWVWVENKIEELLWPTWVQTSQEIISPYRADDIFYIQFGHYNKFLDKVNNRHEDDWVYIAWTYARYFVENQYNVRYDQFLTWLWEMFSDNDVCNSYLRLKDQWINYIALDPNIGTVVMWDGNVSLFHRFFANFNEQTWEIIDHWSISMLAALAQEWYVDYVSSNNIWAKYAFYLSNSELESVLWESDPADLKLLRARMSTARYWSWPNSIEPIIDIFNHRLSNFKAVSDLADMSWITLEDADALSKYAEALIDWTAHQNIEIINEINELEQGDKEVLLNFIDLYSLYQEQPQQYHSTIQWLINQSISSSSQIIVLEVK